MKGSRIVPARLALALCTALLGTSVASAAGFSGPLFGLTTGPSGELLVADTGAGIDETPVPGTGIGLVNIRERLALLYGDRATLELGENEPRGFRARIALPREAMPSSVPFVPVMTAR